MPKKFQKRSEDFQCENCHQPVKGTGYTNHCPACLWSKHVDINPGDRQADCGGLMKPIGLLLRDGERIIVHSCLKCGHQKLNTAQSLDNEDLIIELSTHPLKLKN